MQNSVMKSNDSWYIDSINRALQSTLEVKSDHSSSNESLLTLLNNSIKDQQRGISLNSSQSSIKEVYSRTENCIALDFEESTLPKFIQLTLIRENNHNKQNTEMDHMSDQMKEIIIKQEESPYKRKNKKRRSDNNENESDTSTLYDPKVKKHKAEDALSIQTNISKKTGLPETKKRKKDKHKDFSVSEIDTTTEYDNTTTPQDELLYRKKKKHKSHEKVNSENETKLEIPACNKLSNGISKKYKDQKKKHKNHNISEQDSFEENENHKDRKKSESITEVSEHEHLIVADGVPKKSKKKHHKDSSSTENFEENKHKHDKRLKAATEISEHKHLAVESLPKKTKQKKHHKDSSISEIVDVYEENKKYENQSTASAITESSSPQKIKKKKHTDILPKILDSIEDDKHKNESFQNAKKKKRQKSYSLSDSEKSIQNLVESLVSKTNENDSLQKVKKKKHHKGKEDTSQSNQKNEQENYYVSPKIKVQCLAVDNQDVQKKSKTMDIINKSLDKVKSDKGLSESDLSTLVDLEVLIPFTVPRLHKIETRISSHPTKQQQKEFKEWDLEVKSGPYSNEEDQKIKANWCDFCKNHDIDSTNPNPFFPTECKTTNILPLEQRLNFARYLAKDLEKRTLFSVYKRFQVLFSTFKKGKFSPEEDNIILTYTKNSSIKNKFAVLATILNRSRDCIKKRHKVLISDVESFSWTRLLLQNLVKYLLEATEVASVDDLKDFSIETIHWKNVEAKMGIPAEKLKRKWSLFLYPKLFTEEFCNLNEIRKMLIDILYDSNETDRKNINWNHLALLINGTTGPRLYKIFSDLVVGFVPDSEKKNFRDCVVYLKTKDLRLRNRQIKKYKYHEGQLLND